jgi:hypothetical protein
MKQFTGGLYAHITGTKAVVEVHHRHEDAMDYDWDATTVRVDVNSPHKVPGCKVEDVRVSAAAARYIAHCGRGGAC